MSKLIVIECRCGKKKCRVRNIRIDPEEGQVWVEILNDDPNKMNHEALMYLDRKGFRDLISAGRRGLKRQLAQKR